MVPRESLGGWRGYTGGDGTLHPGFVGGAAANVGGCVLGDFVGSSGEELGYLLPTLMRVNQEIFTDLAPEGFMVTFICFSI